MQFSLVAAFNRSKLCTVWGAVLRSSLSCALWPLFVDDTVGASGLNITDFSLNVSDFNATLNISSGLAPEVERLLAHELNNVLEQLKPDIIGALPSLSAVLASAGSAAILAQLPFVQTQCQPPLVSTSIVQQTDARAP
eukprot:SAG31_NODE_8984_length_1353_cov_1.165869_1_plen_137_part_10